MRKIFFAACSLFIFSGVALAANQPKEMFFPASNISLTYDAKTTTLHVQADHPSQNWDVDFVRMMTVSVNGQAVSSVNYSHQTGPGFSDDAPVTAKPGDVIAVDLFCTGGMDNSQQLTVVAAGSAADAAAASQ